MIISSTSAPEKIISQEKNTVIEVKNLSKKYGTLTALDQINFSVKQGEIFGLIGPDGAGKTTTFHILAGIMNATEGEITILDTSPRNALLAIGYVPQQLSIYLDLTIDENLEYSAGLRKIPSSVFKELRTKYLHLMGLEKFKNRLAKNLSGGMKQKLALSCVLISQPQILLLDEPTTGVDPVSRRELWDDLANIANEGVTIVVTTPYFDEAERCNRIAFIHNGKIQEIGTLSQLRHSLNCSRLEIQIQQIEKAENVLMPLLDSSAQITDIQTFGDRLDVLVKDTELGKQEIETICQQNNLETQNISTSEPTLENVFVARLRSISKFPELIAFPRLKPVKKISENNQENIAIQAINLSKKFGKFEAVKKINLDIHYGEIYGLLGANGAGKTTTIKMLCGLLEKTAGKINLAGETQNLRSSKLRQKIGYMSQKFTLYDDLTIKENLQFYCGVYGVPQQKFEEKIDWVLKTCGLIGKETLLTGNLPGGWKQRVAFGASVMHEPEILFLDEPTSGVDPLARRQFWRLINDFARQGTAILVTTHYLEEAEHCHRMGFLVGGELVQEGTANEIKTAQPGKLLEIMTENNQIVSNLLKNKLPSWQVSIFGDRLHIVINNPEREIWEIKQILETNNININSWRDIPFSLEDAFIGIVQRAGFNNN